MSSYITDTVSLYENGVMSLWSSHDLTCRLGCVLKNKIHGVLFWPWEGQMLH